MAQEKVSVTGVYPANISRIALGPGVYNPGTNSYTSETTYYDIPVNLRGHMRFYILRMTGTF